MTNVLLTQVLAVWSRWMEKTQLIVDDEKRARHRFLSVSSLRGKGALPARRDHYSRLLRCSRDEMVGMMRRIPPCLSNVFFATLHVGDKVGWICIPHCEG